jgi:phosphoenolpyruvate---glycerone phosphotransferase subunit DhaL
MTGITPAIIHTALKRAAATARTAEAELNAADSKLGDGDTGQMLRRLLEKLEAAIPPTEGDLGASFQAFAKASASATGSSLGTLVTVAMLTLAKETRGRAEMPWSDLSGLLARVRDAMIARGGAALGDKTVVDILDAVAQVLSGVNSSAQAAAAARKAASGALETFRARPNRIGRARMFGDKSIGVDDPGMLAFSRLLDGVCADQVL